MSVGKAYKTNCANQSLPESSAPGKVTDGARLHPCVVSTALSLCCRKHWGTGERRLLKAPMQISCNPFIDFYVTVGMRNVVDSLPCCLGEVLQKCKGNVGIQAVYSLL